MSPKNRAGIALVIALAAVLLPAVVSACPLCKYAKSDADYLGGSASLPSGFYSSILLMVSAPFAVVGTFIFRVILAKRRAAALIEPGTAATEAAGQDSRTPL